MNDFNGLEVLMSYFFQKMLYMITMHDAIFKYVRNCIYVHYIMSRHLKYGFMCSTSFHSEDIIEYLDDNKEHVLYNELSIMLWKVYENFEFNCIVLDYLCCNHSELNLDEYILSIPSRNYSKEKLLYVFVYLCRFSSILVICILLIMIILFIFVNRKDS